jgi:hypothetical protein
MPKISQLSRDLREFKRDLDKAIRTTNRQVGRGALALAHVYSRGTVKSAILQAPLGVSHFFDPDTGKYRRFSQRVHGSRTGLGAPYGHTHIGWLGPRGPIPYGDPAWINKQSGEFDRSWKLVDWAAFAGSPTLYLINVSPHAKFLAEGTSLMIRRPLDDVLNAYVARVAPAILRYELDKLWAHRFVAK